MSQAEHNDIVDAHIHCSEFWYEPVESALFHMDRFNVSRAVIVQISGQYDNNYLRSCIRRYPDRFVSVVHVDTRREDACDELVRLVGEGAIGVRLSTADRSPGPDPLAIWRTAERLKISVSIRYPRKGSTTPEALSEFADLIAEVPKLPIILEHLGRREKDSDEDDVREREQTFDLSRFPNVYMKVGGVGEIADKPRPLSAERWNAEAIPPYHAMALKAFGASRLMWGSDYPPVSHREGYGGSLASCQERFAELPEVDRRLIFSGTASRLFFSNRATTP